MKTNFKCQIGKQIIIKSEKQETNIDMSNVAYIMDENFLTIFHMLDLKCIPVSKSFKDFEHELSEFGFLKVNHSTLVNINHVKEFFLGNKRIIMLINGIKLKVSRRRVYLFRDN